MAMEITHVIFDMDGLLLDTERFYTLVSQELAQNHGKVFDWGVKAKLMGQPALQAATIFVAELGIPQTPEEHLAERELKLEQMFPKAELLPGVERLLRHFHAHGIPIAVATSSHSRNFDLKTTNHKEVFSLFATIVKGDDPEVKRGKPAPDIFQLASSRFPSPPRSPANVLVFEDAPNGIQAAKAAEMWAVMVPDPAMDKDLTKLADQIIYSMADFDPTTWGLPAFKN